jgi:hypothetical protein
MGDREMDDVGMLAEERIPAAIIEAAGWRLGRQLPSARFTYSIPGIRSFAMLEFPSWGEADRLIERTESILEGRGLFRSYLEELGGDAGGRTAEERCRAAIRILRRASSVEAFGG